jgi:hypothetical protein
MAPANRPLPTRFGLKIRELFTDLTVGTARLVSDYIHSQLAASAFAKQEPCGPYLGGTNLQ